MQHYLATGEGPVLNRIIEITALHRDGHEFPVELTIVPIPDGDRVAFSGFVRDISERRAWNRNCNNRKRWRRSVSWRAAWPTTSTTY
ncbi:MAG: PAS domain S-box protein [Gemmataceae bacterium]|nr:PAS domain S-box protein [Gemmataceae bacterium]